MNSIFCRTTSSSSSVSSSSKTARDVVSSEEITIEVFEKSIDEWENPKIQKDHIYKTSKLTLFKTNFSIKIEERDI